jgi:TPP-dependent pyruvate/acetoin dehydrogenase alpha subunit
VAAAFIHSVSDPLTQWRKAILTAGTKKLPIIFVHYSDPIGVPSSSPAAKPEALVHGVPSIAVDASDPVAVYRVAYEAITRARQLRGATLLECVVESKPAPPSKYKDSLADRPPTDSVAAIERYLRSKQIDPEAHSQQIITAFSRELDLATRFLDK